MKKFILIMVLINAGLIYIGYATLIRPYKDTIAIQKMAMIAFQETTKKNHDLWKEKVSALEAEKQATEELLLQTQNDLDLFYTFQKAGLKADSLETIRQLAGLAENMPFGSPFRDGHIITDKFGIRDERWFNGDGVHGGIDIISKGSWEILATADGYISDFGYNDTYGRYIEYITDSGYKLIYAHLSKIYWQEGTTVRNIHLIKGTRIARMGNTGLTSGPHLHLEIHMKDNDGNYIRLDPEAIINYIGN